MESIIHQPHKISLPYSRDEGEKKIQLEHLPLAFKPSLPTAPIRVGHLPFLHATRACLRHSPLPACKLLRAGKAGCLWMQAPMPLVGAQIPNDE